MKDYFTLHVTLLISIHPYIQRINYKVFKLYCAGQENNFLFVIIYIYLIIIIITRKKNCKKKSVLNFIVLLFYSIDFMYVHRLRQDLFNSNSNQTIDMKFRGITCRGHQINYKD